MEHPLIPKAPQRRLQAKPKARVSRAALSEAPADESSPENVSEAITTRAPPRRRVSVEAPEAQQARQVSNLLRPLAAIIAPGPSVAPTLMLINPQVAKRSADRG